MKRSILVITLLLVVLTTYFLVKKNICSVEVARQNSNSGVAQSCTCKGVELEIKNDLPVDGARVTTCLGVISSTTKQNTTVN